MDLKPVKNARADQIVECVDGTDLDYRHNNNNNNTTTIIITITTISPSFRLLNILFVLIIMTNAPTQSRLPVLCRNAAPQKRVISEQAKGEIPPDIKNSKKKRWDVNTPAGPKVQAASNKSIDKSKLCKPKPPVFDTAMPASFLFTKSGLQMGVKFNTRGQSTTVSKNPKKLKHNSRSAAAFGISALVKSEAALFEKTDQQSATIEALEGEVIQYRAEVLKFSENVNQLEKENRDCNRKLYECQEFLKIFHLDPESGKPIVKAILKKDLNTNSRKNCREVLLQQRRLNERPETTITSLKAICDQAQSMMSSTAKIHEDHMRAMKNFMAKMETLQQEVNSDNSIL
uniref:Uncharacterized protein LOC116943147 n=1 Tax=Petromyzon marinus TaxID=7757 RepID=A0AAJ7T751_PETMA|nr:uncharacterized protein LOC116943147 [Petromyzon marinus]